MSRGYYGLFQDDVYELDGKNFLERRIVTPRENIFTCNQNNQSIVDLSLMLSDLDANAFSNKELFERTVAKLQADKTTELKRLSNHYRMFIDYSIIDLVTNQPVDAGVMTKDMRGEPGFYILGLDEENEYVGRFVMSFGCTFERKYRDICPLGTTTTLKHQYVINIESVKIGQYFEANFSMEPDTGNKTAAGNTIIDNNKYPDNYPDNNFPMVGYNSPIKSTYRAETNSRKCGPDCYHPTTYVRPNDVHPSMTWVSDNNFIKEYSLMIYDSSLENRRFTPILTNGSFRNLVLNVNIDLCDYLITRDTSDIYTVLRDNKEIVPLVTE